MFHRFHFFLSFVFIVFGFTFGVSSHVSFAVESSELNFSSGTYIPGYTNSKWSSWGRLGGIIGGAPIDPVNQWVGCDPHNPDEGCWNPESTTFRCPEYSQVYEYAYDSIAKNYQYYAPFEFINSGDTGFASQYLDLQKIRFERWEKCSASGSVVTPYGGQCGDGNVNIGEQCDPPGRTVLYDNSCPLGSYATATCNSSCQFEYGACSASTAVCGNGRVDSGEACDAGTQNGQYGSRCTVQCQIATVSNGQFCGNGTLDRNVQGNHLEFCEEQNGACVHINDNGQIIKSRVHTLLDRSGSMNTAVPNTGKTRWQNAVSGLTTIYTSLLSNVNFSLSVFSSSTTECYRDLGPITTANSNSVLNALAPSGQTPTRCALQDVLNKKDSIFGTDDSVPKKLILITDGTPSDGTDQQTAALIQQLKENNILTYVVGFSSVPSSTLNLFAEAGGTTNPLSASDKFFKAEKAAEFVTAFNEILGCFEYSQYKQNSCSWDCQNYGEYCGDGIVQQQHGEECEVSLSSPGSCDAYCKLTSGPPPVCGNTQVEAGEQCDDGNVINGDGCSTVCSFESSTAACGNSKVETVNGTPEQCDLGPQNGLVCDPQYDGSCTYCSNKCETITLESDAFCGNGSVDAINPTVREACDYIGGDAVTGSGIVLSCPDKGNYTCSNSCLQLTPNCVSCGVTSTSRVVPKISILNPLTQAGYSPYTPIVGYVDLYRKNPPGSTSLALNWLGYRKINYRTANANSYIDPFDPYTMLIDANYQPVTNIGIESNTACNGEYVLLFNKNHISQVKTNSTNGLSPVQVVDQKLGDLFDYPVSGGGSEVLNEVVMSPAIPEEAIRIVTRWKKKPAGVLFMGEFYQDKTNQSPSQDGNTFSYFKNVVTTTGSGGQSVVVQDGNYGQMGLVNGYWRPISDGVPPTAPGVYMNKFLNPAGSKTAVQGVTLYASSLSSNKPLGFYVASPNGPINQYKDYELWVDVYTYQAGQVPEHSIYQPLESFSLGEAVPSINPVARYWHVFNLGVTGTGSARKIAVQKITGANSGLIVTNQCGVRENMPDTTRCGGLVPFSGGNDTPLFSLSVPAAVTVGVAQDSTASVAVTSNVSPWTVEENVGWLTIDAPASGSNNGSFVVRASQTNITGSNRSADVTVGALGVTPQTVRVTQLAATPASITSLSISPTTFNPAPSGGSRVITVTSNVDWIVSGNWSWFSVSANTGSNNGSFTITATPNNTGSFRSGNVTVTGGGKTETVTVSQDALVGEVSNSLSVNPNPVTLASTNQSAGLASVNSTVSWTLGGNIPSWLTVSRTTGPSGTTQVTFTANSANPSATERTANFSFSYGGSTLPFSVTQSGTASSLSVSRNSITLASTSGSTNANEPMSVGSTNVNWSISGVPSWLSVSPTTGGPTANTNLVFTALSVNNSPSNRPAATVVISGSGVPSQIISVTQSGIAPSIGLNKSEIKLAAPAGSSDSTVTVTSNVNWNTGSSNAALVTVTPSTGQSPGGTLVIRAVTANTNATERTLGTITVSGSGATSQIVTVKQLGTTAPPAELTVPSTATVGAAQNDQVSIAVDSNVSWSVTDNASWLTVLTPANGSNDGSFIVQAAQDNPNVSARTAQVTVIGGIYTRTINVTQEAANLTVTKAASTLVAGSGTDTSASVTSNVTWTATPNANWIHVTSPVGGSAKGDRGITVSYDPNPSASSRSASVSVKAGNITRQFVLSQPGIAFTTDSPRPKVATSTVVVNVTSNAPWTVTENTSWITSLSPSAGTGNGTVTVSYNTNPTQGTRTGALTFNVSGQANYKQTNLVQHYFYVVPPSGGYLQVSPNGGTSAALSVQTDTEWGMLEAYPWFSLTRNSANSTGLTGNEALLFPAFGNGTVTVTADPIPAGSTSRSGLFRVYVFGGVGEWIEVRQTK